ncbi:type II secretory pathway component PulK [Brevundimonas variabilis]|uniref:Type II secretory pathway component PulK n=1 Tax=Brevundimonas variabilis TaxID=74312 RepID=A0A7W9FFE2_9CAUL|nr:type II secretory pathway component PulK [Brevundimonas variabilis]
MISTRLRPRAGFALPAVLAVTGVVTLVFLVAITALASLNAEARSARDRIRFMQGAMTAEAAIAYLAATNPIDSQSIVIGGQRTLDVFDTASLAEDANAGVGTPSHLHLDGRSYDLAAPQSLTIQIQDQAGLINLAALDSFAQRRLFGLIGVAENEAPQLIAAFRDYVDTDDLRQIDGAEAAQYGTDGPANRPLRRASEWLSVKGARAAVDPALWRRIRPDLVYDRTSNGVNVNTMTPAAIAVVFGLSAEQAQAAIRARRQAPFLSINAFETVTGQANLGDPERVYTFPTRRMVYTIHDSRSPWTYRGRLTLTPTGNEQPFWIDQTEQTEAPRRAVAPKTDATPFPDPTR